MLETRGVMGGIRGDSVARAGETEWVTGWTACWGQERCDYAVDRKGDSSVGIPGMRKLMGAAVDKSINVVMGMLWTGWVVWCPGTREVMG